MLLSINSAGKPSASGGSAHASPVSCPFCVVQMVDLLWFLFLHTVSHLFCIPTAASHAHG